MIDLGPYRVTRDELLAALEHQRARDAAAWATRRTAPCPLCGHPIGAHVERAGGRLRPGVHGNGADFRRECDACPCTLGYREHPW